MFSRASILFVSVLSIFAAASVLPRHNGPSSQCNTGSLQCCNSVQSSSSASAISLLEPLGVMVGSVTGLVGVGCSGIHVVDGNSFCDQPVCCTHNSFNGVVALGCSPININL